MNGFNGLQIDWEDGMVYIYEEDGSGCEYPADTIEEVVAHIAEYLGVMGEQYEVKNVLYGPRNGRR